MLNAIDSRRARNLAKSGIVLTLSVFVLWGAGNALAADPPTPASKIRDIPEGKGFPKDVRTQLMGKAAAYFDDGLLAAGRAIGNCLNKFCSRAKEACNYARVVSLRKKGMSAEDIGYIEQDHRYCLDVTYTFNTAEDLAK